jgi:hypothetical protein
MKETKKQNSFQESHEVLLSPREKTIDKSLYGSPDAKGATAVTDAGRRIE